MSPPAGEPAFHCNRNCNQDEDTIMGLNVDSMFPSKYLRAADLPRRGLTLVIDTIEEEEVGGDRKFVLYFTGGEKRGLCLNKTNCLVIADAYGRDTDEWSGRSIHLRTERVPFQGSRVDAIRVSVVDFDDELPDFTAAKDDGAAA
jgi:hypothetical protein